MARKSDTAINTLPTAIAYCTYRRLLRPFIRHDAPFVVCVVLQDASQFDFHEAAIRLLMAGGKASPSARRSRQYHVRKVFPVKGKVDELFEDALAYSQVFLLFENEDDISREVRAAADKVHVFGNISPRIMRAAIYHVTADKIPLEDAAYLAASPWQLVAMSFRQGRSTYRAIDRVRFWNDLKSPFELPGVTSQSVPSPEKQRGLTLENLYGYGEAREWGLRLKKDLNDVSAGEIGFEDIDSGLLLSGPPGAGKTMFAEALAATCGIPLFTASFAKWQAAGHLGDCLREMRKTFADAQASAPSVLFVDEVDSVIRRSNGFTSDDYMRLFTNGFLECMDGSKRREGVIVVGATNLPDGMEPALLRPGRFGKHIRINLPNADDRIQILAQYLNVSPSSIDDRKVRLGTEGMSGDHLRELAKQARQRARDAKRHANVSDVVSQLPEILSLPQDHLWINSLHEAGHALVAQVVGREIEDITIADVLVKSDNPQVGGTVKVKVPEFARRNEAYYLDDIAICLAGMAAEDELLGSHDDGVGGVTGSDLVSATDKATLIVAHFGMAGTLVAEVDNGPEAAAALRRNNPIIWRLVNEVLQRQLERVKLIIGDNRDLLEFIADALATSRRMTGAEFRKLIDGFDASKTSTSRPATSSRIAH